MLFRQAEEIKREHGHGPPHNDPPPIEEMHRKVGHLKEKIDHLHREGRHEEAKDLEREVEKIHRHIEEMEREHGHGPPHHGPPRDPERRAHILNAAAKHMFKAAERLHEAEVHELAENLAREAERVREEAQKRTNVKEACEIIGGLKHEISQLRHDVNRLRDQVNELRDHVHHD